MPTDAGPDRDANIYSESNNIWPYQKNCQNVKNEVYGDDDEDWGFELEGVELESHTTPPKSTTESEKRILARNLVDHYSSTLPIESLKVIFRPLRHRPTQNFGTFSDTNIDLCRLLKVTKMFSIEQKIQFQIIDEQLRFVKFGNYRIAEIQQLFEAICLLNDLQLCDPPSSFLNGKWVDGNDDSSDRGDDKERREIRDTCIDYVQSVTNCFTTHSTYYTIRTQREDVKHLSKEELCSLAGFYKCLMSDALLSRLAVVGHALTKLDLLDMKVEEALDPYGVRLGPNPLYELQSSNHFTTKYPFLAVFASAKMLFEREMDGDCTYGGCVNTILSFMK